MTDAQLLPGQPLSLHQVDRLVLLLSEMSGVVASTEAPINRHGSAAKMLKIGNITRLRPGPQAGTDQ